MSCRIIVALFLAVIATTHAGFFDDVSGKATEVGNFFTKQFNNVKDLFAGNQSELEKNVDRVKGLLMEIKEKMKMLEPMANDAQKKTLSQIGNYLDEVTQFGDKYRFSSYHLSYIDSWYDCFDQLINYIVTKGLLII
ncbi:hypothetical protein DICVIV_08935 [Dictyocaulus viviparus]|uniref:Uncharacterized protein n=1 Tax=Dictyocaulus viviparus TaxID=29172 RepID=A0A0D8XMR3_DICVI|nr:hypothetical protein DICVIV_08935 [Dictyocaulus viviparus]